MKWLEIIELRATEGKRDCLEAFLKELSEDVMNASENHEINIYCRVMPYVDFGIHIFHNSEEAEGAGSQLGLHLMAILKVHGIVRHSIWIGLNDE